MSTRTPRSRSRSLAHSFTAATALSILIAATAVLVWTTPESASAQTPDEMQEQRTSWNERYRVLLRDRVRLEQNIVKSKNNYSLAQHRNYPRGGARQQFLIDAEDAAKELASTEEAIVELFAAAREANVPPAWLYEVEDEPIVSAQPNASEEDEEDDRAGRNPAHFADDDEDKDNDR